MPKFQNNYVRVNIFLKHRLTFYIYVRYVLPIDAYQNSPKNLAYVTEFKHSSLKIFIVRSGIKMKKISVKK